MNRGQLPTTYLPVIWVHDACRMHPNYWQITIMYRMHAQITLFMEAHACLVFLKAKVDVMYMNVIKVPFNCVGVSVRNG